MKTILIIAFVILISSADVFSKNTDYSVDTILIQSEILNEQRKVIIYKPADVSYSDSVKFIYLIDGEYSNYRYNLMKERYGDSLSNMIAVGIINTERIRDLLYARSADKFLEFITSELIPSIEKDYITKTRILYGHSLGGGFTIYTMINKPNTFNCYIASSPTPIMDLIQKENYLTIDSLSTNKTSFYFSYGSKDMGQVRKWSNRLKENLTGLHFNNFEWWFNIFEGKDHNNSDGPALLNGLNDVMKQ